MISSDIVIRPAKSLQEWASTCTVLAMKEGWNDGQYDASVLFETDPQGCLVASLLGEDEPVGCISAMKYGDSHGFIGFYIVKPAFRGKGYGKMLFNAAMKHLEGRKIGLDAVIDQIPFYSRMGFKQKRWNVTTSMTVSEIPLPVLTDNKVVDIRSIDIDDVIAYESRVLGFGRPKSFYESLLQNQQFQGIVSLDKHSAVNGLISFRPSSLGATILSPFYAVDVPTAQGLLFNLFQQHSISLLKKEIRFDAPKDNPNFQAVFQTIKTLTIFECVRMWTEDVAEAVDEIYIHLSLAVA